MPLKYNTDNIFKKQENKPGILSTVLESLLRNLDCHARDRYQRKKIDFVEFVTQNVIAF